MKTLNKVTIDDIIYPVKTKKGIKFKKSKKKVKKLDAVPFEMNGKLLDGFLLLYSCRVKLPHEAIRSKLSGQNIVEVVEEDLCYF